MAVKTLGSRINTGSFSHASGSVPRTVSCRKQLLCFFPRKWDVKNHNQFWIFTGIGKSVILGIYYTFSPLFEEMFQHLFFLA